MSREAAARGVGTAPGTLFIFGVKRNFDGAGAAGVPSAVMDGNCTSDPVTKVTFLVEGRAPGKSWVVFGGSDDEAKARGDLLAWRESRDHIEFRLIRKTSSITYEILE